MADVNISKYRAQVVREGSRPASPGFVVSEGQDPVDPAGSGQNHLPVTIASASTGLAITNSQVLGGAGTVAQYIRGDGSLADFPATTGGGASVSYYLNGSVSQGTIGGVAYREVNRNPVFGAGTDISISSDGYIASFITDAGDPNKLEIPAGNWNLETYFSASSSGGTPSFYVELYKYNGATFTLIASSATSPELIAFGTNLNPYFSTLAVPQTTLALTDRLALRFYVNTSGRTITLHTENDHLCQVITTFTTGLTALNGLTTQVQFFAVGTSGTDFAISSATDTHTFNLPTASGTNRGALSSADWSTFNGKQNALGYTPVPETRTITINGTTQDLSANRTYNVGDMLLNTYQAVTGTKIFDPNRLLMAGEGTAQPTSLSNTQVSIAALTGHNSFGFNSSNNIYFNKGTTANGGIIAFSNSATRTYTLKDSSGTLAFTSDIPTNPVGGTGTTNYLAKFTGTSTIGNSLVFDNGTSVGINNASPNAGYQLDVNGFIRGTGYGVFSNSLNVGFLLRHSDWTGVPGSNNLAIASNQGNLTFFTNGSATERMQLTAGGNLLVGTTTDAGFKLDVNGTGRFSNVLRVMTHYAEYSDAEFMGALGFNRNPATGAIFNNARAAFQLQNNLGTFQFRAFSSAGSDLGTPLSIASTGAATFSSSVTANARSFIQGAAGYLFDVQTTDANQPRFQVYVDDTNGVDLISGYNSTAKSLRFVTGNSPRMTITSSGNVGIGTSSPQTIFSVETSGVENTVSPIITSQSFGTTYTGIYSIRDGAGDQRGLIFQNYTANVGLTEKMRITSGGNVGIGTSSPSNILQITAAAGSSHARWTESATTVGFVGGAQGIITGHNGKFAVRAESGLVLSGSGNSADVVIASGGNVLIGTTTDNGSKLQVSGSVTSFSFLASDATGSAILTTNGGGEGVLSVNTANPLRFFTNASERMRITSSGNVGIGTTGGINIVSGWTNLTVNGSTTGLIGVKANEVDYGAMYASSANNAFVIQAYGSSNNGVMVFLTASTERMRITSSGNVLIGTTTDAGDKLQVNGSIKTSAPSGGTAGSWKLGTASSGSFTVGGKIRIEINGVAYDILTT